MARKSQHKLQGPGPAGGHFSAQKSSTTGSRRADAIQKTKSIEELVAPVFSFPFTSTYTSELEISDSEDMPGNTTETAGQTIGQDRKRLNHENQIQYSHATGLGAKSWDQRSQIRRGQPSSQNYTPGPTRGSQSSIEERFDDTGEVALEIPDRQQGEGYYKELRSGKGQKRSSRCQMPLN